MTNIKRVTFLRHSVVWWLARVWCTRRRVPLHDPTSLSEHQNRVSVPRRVTTTARRPLRTFLLRTDPRYKTYLCVLRVICQYTPFSVV